MLKRLFGGGDEPMAEQRPRRSDRPELSEDERAIERYRYMLRTAPPETLEAAHAEAFAQLTPEQRRQVLDQLTTELPPSEVPANSEDSRELARAATRAEMRRPGTLERQFGGRGAGGMGAGGMGGGMGMGGLMAGSFLSTIAGVMVGSAIANAFFADSGYNDATGEGAGADEAAADGGDGGDTGGDAGGDGGGFGDFGGGDFAGGDFGGDFGGGEF